MTRIRNFIILLRGQLWLIPVVIGVGGLALAYNLIHYGGALLTPQDIGRYWLYSGDASSARETLASLLTGLITMTALVVTITFVILTLSANQLGPRLISNFIADRQIQAALGLFLGTILYLIAVLRSVDEELGADAVPHIAVTAGTVLTIFCLFALLFYLHKVARSIIADNVVNQVAGSLTRQIRANLPTDKQRSDADSDTIPLSGAAALALGKRGYIQTVDYAALVGLAQNEDVVLDVQVRAGHFVLERGKHVLVQPPDRLDDEDVAALRQAFVIGDERTQAQDVEYSIRQLVEIAVRALSPGINDPFTAIAVVDRLGGAIEDVLARSVEPRALRDETGTVRVLASRSDLDGLFDAAYDMIREAARNHASVLIRMADVFGQLAPSLAEAQARTPALRHLHKLSEMAQHSSLVPTDRADVLRRIESARAAIEQERTT